MASCRNTGRFAFVEKYRAKNIAFKCMQNYDEKS